MAMNFSSEKGNATALVVFTLASFLLAGIVAPYYYSGDEKYHDRYGRYLAQLSQRIQTAMMDYRDENGTNPSAGDSWETDYLGHPLPAGIDYQTTTINGEKQPILEITNPAIVNNYVHYTDYIHIYEVQPSSNKLLVTLSFEKAVAPQ